MAFLVSWANLTLQDVLLTHGRAEELLYVVQLSSNRVMCIGCKKEYAVNECALELWYPVRSSRVTEIGCIYKLTACIEWVTQCVIDPQSGEASGGKRDVDSSDGLR